MYVKGSSFGAWYDTLSADTQRLTAEWARRSGVTGTDAEVLTKIARTPAQGGGFVAGGIRMCLSNRPGGPTEPMRAESVPCPSGSGGIAGEQVKEITAAEVAAINRANDERRRTGESTDADVAPVAVEVRGVVLNGSGAPIQGVSVVVGTITANRTGPTGEFLATVLPGTYTVTASHGDYLGRMLTDVVVPTAAPLQIVMTQTEAKAALDVAKQEEGTATAPWYKSTWFWAGVAVVSVGGVGYWIWQDRKKRG
jgi:hypothetical protein